MTRKPALALAVALIVATPLVAAPKRTTVSLADVIKKVQAQQKSTNSLQASFRQEKVLALLSKPEVSTGTFVYSKPNNVLWSYNAPKRVQMLIANGTLTTFYPDLNKAEKLDVTRFQDRIFKYMGASGAIDELARYFDFTFTDNAGNSYFILDLNPNSKVVAKRVKHIKIFIDRATYLTNKFEYVEGDGDITRYEFTNLKINQPVPSGTFALNLPANVRVEQMKLQ